jgi:hypothetical protein
MRAAAATAFENVAAWMEEQVLNFSVGVEMRQFVVARKQRCMDFSVPLILGV